MIRSYCNQTDVILDFNFDAILLGRQFLKVLNSGSKDFRFTQVNQVRCSTQSDQK